MVMRALVVVAACLTASVMTPRASQQASQPTTGTAAISGVVVDATTGKPVAGATVSLGRTDAIGRPGPRMVADARGRFVFRNLPAAQTYYLDARRFGYAATRWGWTAPNQSSAIKDITQISVADDQWVSTIRIPLWRLGAIAGRVVDERGEPAVGVAVRAFSTVTIAGAAQFVGGPIATTDDRGAYRLSGLAPGRYVVSVLSVQSTVPSAMAETPLTKAVGELEGTTVGGGRGAPVIGGPGIDVDGAHRLVITQFATPPPPSQGRPRAYPAVFYPAARGAADAMPLDIGYGDNRTGTDFQLRPVAGSRLSGRVDAGNAPPPPFVLRLMPAGSERLGFGSEAATTTVERNGTFTFLGVPDGDYTLIAQSGVMDFASGTVTSRIADAPGFARTSGGVGSFPSIPDLEFLTRGGPAAPLWGRLVVSVDGRDRDDLVVPLRSTVQISGKVVFEEGTKRPAPNGSISISLEPANGDPTLGRMFEPIAASVAQPTFAVGGLLAGTYLIGNFRGAPYSLVSATWQGRDLTDVGFDAAAGHDFDEVVITLTDRLTKLTGTVRDSQGPANAAVIVFPLSRERWTSYGWTPRLLRTARSASNGAFELPYLPDGEYYLVAVPIKQADLWSDAKFLAAAAPLATRISIKWGDTLTQDLAVATVTVK